MPRPTVFCLSAMALCLAPVTCILSAQAPVAPASAARSVSCPVQPSLPSTDASRAFATGDFTSAASLYQSQVAAHPTDAAYAGLVGSQLQQNKLADALATAQAATTALKASAGAQALLGFVLLRSGQIAEASTAFAKASALDHCSAPAIYGGGLISQLSSRHAAAAQQFKIAHSLLPSNPEYTAAYLSTLPDSARLAPLQALIASSPALAPEALDRLKLSLAILKEHKSCTVTEPGVPTRVDLQGLMSYGAHPRSWGFRYHINNADMALTELDSGVSGIVLNPRDAKAAKVKPFLTDQPPAKGMYYAVADKINIGNLEYHDCIVRVASSDILANANSLIGTDFFRDRLIHIDYVTKLLTLTTFAPSDAADRATATIQKGWFPVYIAGSNILVPTLINKKGPSLFLFDTGSPTSVFAPSVADKRLLTYKDSQLNQRGFSGAIIKVLPQFGGGDVDHALVYNPSGEMLKIGIPIKIPYLAFTNTEILESQALSFDIEPKSHDTGIELAGLLGFSVIDQFFVDLDYRHGLIQLAYDPDHLYNARELDRRN